MSAHHRKLNQRKWRAVRRQAVIEANWRCSECEAPWPLEVHHRVALEDGGAPYDLANLVALCVPCHQKQTRRQVAARSEVKGKAEWLERIGAI